MTRPTFAPMSLARCAACKTAAHASGPDFPAAHSMDTTWFAVDAEGNIGEFATGEDGALPIAAESDLASLESAASLFSAARTAHFAVTTGSLGTLNYLAVYSL